MATKDELDAYVHRTFSVEAWTTQEGLVVPATKDIALNNTAKHFKLATFLYADMNDSTKMVENLSWTRAAEIYKSYLYCASRLIRHHEGEVVAFDGDRVLGVFLGGLQSSNATKCAMRIHWALHSIVMPSYVKQYGNDFQIGHTVGVDVSEARCCRTGVRGDNDLVWVGSAANTAAKLTGIKGAGPLWITDTIYNRITNEVKISKDGIAMWEERTWTAMDNRTIYASNWSWSL